MRIYFSDIQDREAVYVKGEVYDITYKKNNKLVSVNLKITSVGSNSIFGDEVEAHVQSGGLEIFKNRIIGLESNYIIDRGYTIRYRNDQGKTTSVIGKILAETKTSIIIEEAEDIKPQY